ncbi:hypothetical protein BJ742DRAFT_835990 [Cladochytrium replicatum]|nr:hypothetical protein BJ742DRAFT_835990 [Cladochytrium replicatum]
MAYAGQAYGRGWELNRDQTVGSPGASFATSAARMKRIDDVQTNLSAEIGMGSNEFSHYAEYDTHHSYATYSPGGTQIHNQQKHVPSKRRRSDESPVVDESPLMSHLPALPMSPGVGTVARPHVPAVFQCVQCLTILADSTGSAAYHADANFLTLEAISQSVDVVEPPQICVDGFLRNCSYKALRCSHCGTIVGKWVYDTPEFLNHILNRFVLEMTAIRPYHLGENTLTITVNVPEPSPAPPPPAVQIPNLGVPSRLSNSSSRGYSDHNDISSGGSDYNAGYDESYEEATPRDHSRLKRESMEGQQPPGSSKRGGLDFKTYPCPRPYCSKVYKNPGGLKYHLTSGTCELDYDAIPAKGGSAIPPNPHESGSDNEDGADGIEDGGEGGSISPNSAGRKIKVTKRPYWCVMPGCSKRYKNLAGLKYHAKTMHPKLRLEDIRGGRGVTTPGSPTGLGNEEGREMSLPGEEIGEQVY